MLSRPQLRADALIVDLRDSRTTISKSLTGTLAGEAARRHRQVMKVRDESPKKVSGTVFSCLRTWAQDFLKQKHWISRKSRPDPDFMRSWDVLGPISGWLGSWADSFTGFRYGFTRVVGFRLASGFRFPLAIRIGFTL